MNRRTSAKFMVFLAYILLFATVVFPHHHHSSTICFKNSHCVNEGIGEKHPGSDHRHDSKLDFCVLVINVLPSLNDEIYSASTVSDQNLYGFDLQGCLFEKYSESDNSTHKPDNPPWVKYPESPNLYFSSGLRAPPVV